MEVMVLQYGMVKKLLYSHLRKTIAAIVIKTMQPNAIYEYVLAKLRDQPIEGLNLRTNILGSLGLK
jgi:hypothetical protein